MESAGDLEVGLAARVTRTGPCALVQATFTFHVKSRAFTSVDIILCFIRSSPIAIVSKQVRASRTHILQNIGSGQLLNARAEFSRRARPFQANQVCSKTGDVGACHGGAADCVGSAFATDPSAENILT